ncbi:Metallo-hydrolase/oxidoreductase [Meredithblackwellia eburnea MCA 4105]
MMCDDHALNAPSREMVPQAVKLRETARHGRVRGLKTPTFNMSLLFDNPVTAEKRPLGPVSVIPDAVSNRSPEGTKLWILDLGTLETDESHIIRGANGGSVSDPHPQHKRRKMAMIAALISHPTEGLILYETGAGKGTGGEDDYQKLWGEHVCDVYPRRDAHFNQELPEAIKATGNDIKDVKHIILGHLHIDHAGGLVFFKGRQDVTLWVHEIELKHAFWGLATDQERGPYLEHYLDLSLNWRTIKDPLVDLFAGLTVYHSPGHTPGLIGLQLNLNKDGPFIFTSDHFHVKENYEQGKITGSLLRDAEDWYNSTEWIRRRHRATNARIVFGHDIDVAHALFKEKPYFE